MILNMKNTRENYLTNAGEDSTEKIKEYLPEFYEIHKKDIEVGHIKLFDECFATETGVIIDLRTTETIFVDWRA